MTFPKRNAGVINNEKNEDLRQKVAALIANLSVEQGAVRAALCRDKVRERESSRVHARMRGEEGERSERVRERESRVESFFCQKYNWHHIMKNGSLMTKTYLL
jgi:hypothetical protein